jgi:fused signal recognition particle receptor
VSEADDDKPKAGLLSRWRRRDDAPAAPEAGEAARRGWLAKLAAGLSRTSSALGRGVADVFAKRKLDADALDALEDILIQADLGLAAATRIREAVGGGRYDKGIEPEAVKAILAEEIARSLEPVARPLEIDANRKPFVVLVVGVNGSGKTTTIGKLAAKFVADGLKVTLAAGDDIVAREPGGDAASLAFEALTRAKATGADVLLIDTAGRLQNRAELMSELEKIVRAIKKVDAEAPHATLLALDATVGQNALSQVEIFGRIAGVTGLVMTKLDGTARGGILVAVAEKFGLPVHFIGVGEGVDDLEPFAARDFAAAIAGVSQENS